MSAETGSQPRAGAIMLVTLLTLLGAGAVILSQQATSERIVANERARRLAELTQVLPVEFDNDPLADTREVVAPALLGSSSALTIYRARRNGEPVGAILEAVARGGYGGPIRLRVGVYPDGTVAGVRVVEHNESAGLGDGIEIEKSNWVRSFEGRSLGNPPSDQWAVRREGGVFDQFTGATVTPRAVIGSVHDALLYFRQNREQILTRNAPQP